MRMRGGADFVKRMGFGHQLIGLADEPGVFRSKNRNRVARSKRGVCERQGEILKQVRRAAKSDMHKSAIYHEAMAEVEKGILHGPVPLEELPENFLPMRRFCVEQSTLEGATKLRHCDNSKKSNLNSLYANRTPVELYGNDEVLAGARAFAAGVKEQGKKEMRPEGPNFGFIKLDHKEAYRHCAIKRKHFRFGVVCCEDPSSGELLFFVALLGTFGPGANVLNYNVLSRVCQTLVRRILAVPCTAFFDDFVAPCALAEAPAILADVIYLLRDLLGQDFREEKCNWGAKIKYLGLFLNWEEDAFLKAEIGEARREKILALLEERLHEGKLAPQHAETLAGKLGFASGGIHGRLGRPFLQPVYGRIYSQSGRWDIAGRLKSALEWWKWALPTENKGALTRKVDVSRAEARVILATDACLDHLGAVLEGPGENKPVKKQLSAPATLTSESTQVIEGEAVLTALGTFKGILKGRRVLLFVDNTAPQGALVKGHSSNAQVANIVYKIHQLAFKLEPDIWFERVSSKANPADGPSRRQLFFKKFHKLKKALQVNDRY